MDTELDLDALRRWIGRSEEQTELLTAAQVQRFLATFDREGSLDDGAEAPLLIHLCLNQPALPASALGSDGHPDRGGFLPPVPLPRRMWAGGKFVLHAPLQIGELVTRRSRIVDIQRKEGRSGCLCFVTVEHEIYSEQRLCITERQDIVYRSADTAPPVAPSRPAMHGALHRVLEPNATLLFRYSALTFNGHRIHYDHPYVTAEEGYPGLVVHGPLQATLLAHLAQDIKGSTMSEFTFRSLSPLFHTSDLTLNANAEANTISLWTARPGGPVAMEARATW